MQGLLRGLAGCALALLGAGAAKAQDTVKIGLIMPYSGQFTDTAPQMDNGIESKDLFAAIAGLSHAIAVLFIEHDMLLVFRFASRVIVMVGGGILIEGTPQEIASDPQVSAVYLGKSRYG